MSKPTVAQLDESLKDLVKNWKRFALHLPGFGSTHIDIIKEDLRDDVVEQKIALYTRWLKVYPDASWDDVAITLEKVDENTIAQQLRDKYLTNVKTKEEVAPTLIGEIANPPANKSVPDSSRIEDEVAIEEDVVTKLDLLEKSFCNLTCEVKREVKGIEQRNGSIEDVVFQVQQARSFRINSLQSVKTTDELFEAIYPHYNFLNCHLIIHIALFLCGIAKKATEYKDSIMKFMKTTKVICFKNVLKRYHQQRRFPAQRKNHYTLIEIKVENGWGDQPLWLVEMLVKTLFPVKHPDELPWYDIVPGSVIMTFIALEHMTPSLIENSRKKTEFMRLIGVISLKIGDELVWQREDRDTVLSFEDSLIRATLADNIEVVQFILQYTQVDINTRNTNHTLIAYDEKEIRKFFTDYLSLKSYYTEFTKLLKDIEYELHRLMEEGTASVDDDTIASIWHPSNNFMNYTALGNVSHLLPEDLLTRVKEYKARLENIIKKRSVLTFLETNLDKYFPTPFPGSIEVIISLHSVWSTCSVWYVEQLGQLIFTPTLFYQLQWFRVDTSEESVRVCLLADGKIMNSLKECVSDNESRTSMLGVVSVQVDDTVMIANRDYSNGYTFDDAIKLAKAIADDDISDLLQQMLLSPKEYREVSNVDNNNNRYFSLDPDSTPLMIACCNDNSQLVQLLLNHNADPNMPNKRDNTALMYSTRNSKIFQMLLDHGADVNKTNFFNYSTLHFASFVDNFEVVKIILDKNSELVHALNYCCQTPLYLACHSCQLEIVEILLQAKADPNARALGLEGYSPLFLASCRGHVKIVEALLQANADPNIKDNDDRTPLYGASYIAGRKEVVESLLKANADPDIQDSKEGKTPLMSACMHQYTDIVEKLLKANANPDIQSSLGQTALMMACFCAYGKIAELLLEAGADPDLKNKEGQTALDLAMETRNTHFIERLCSALYN